MLRCAAEREWKWVDFCCCCLGDSVVSVFVSDSISLIITLIKLFGSQPAWYNSVCKYKRFWMFSALSRNVLINRKPCTCNSPVPPPLFSIPTSKRKRTGSPHRSRSVDSASDTDVWPLSTLFGVPWPSTASSHAFVSNCIARIRDRMPWPVAEAANGNKPTVDVPRRKQASGHRVQHTNRHCLQSKKQKTKRKNMNNIWSHYKYYHKAILTDRPIHRSTHGDGKLGQIVRSALVNSTVGSIESNAVSPTELWHHPTATRLILARN